MGNHLWVAQQAGLGELSSWAVLICLTSLTCPAGALWGSGSPARGNRKNFHSFQRKWCGSDADTAAHTGRIWLLDLDRKQKLRVLPMDTRVHTQTDKALKPPKKNNFYVELLQLLLLIIFRLTDIDFSMRALCPAFINILPHFHIPSCMPARFGIPQVCYCRPRVLLKCFLVAQRHWDFNSKCSIHSPFFSSASFFLIMWLKNCWQTVAWDKF